MCKKFVLCITSILTLFVVLPVVNADDPPSPLEVANTVSNYWMTFQFTDLDCYITNLYASHSNYFPAILASTFHDVVFRGELAEASNKVYRIQECVDNNPSNYNESFRMLVSSVNNDIAEEIALHASRGTTSSQLESNASPLAVRNASDHLGRDIIILYYTPATNAP
jgi:hypothetical protein